MSKRLLIPAVFILFAVIIACQPSGDKNNNQANNGKNEEKQSVSLKVDRLEMDLFSIPVDSIEEKLPELENKYGVFLDIFSNKIINIGSRKKPGYATYLKSFITDRYMFTSYERIKKEYPDFKEQKLQLENAFQRYHELFPDRKIPHIYTLMSGFNQSLVTADTILGISLDKYLGKNCEFYGNLQIPIYQRRIMDKSYLVTDAVRGWCYSEFLYNDSAENLLTNILYQGKIIYLMKALFPETHDSIIYGFTNKQLNWCKANTNPMWTYLVEHKLLFTTDYMTINKLTNPAPFTAYFTTESPGRAVNWLGYLIVKSYMDNNKVSLPDLLKDQKYQNLLEQSKFQP